MPKLTIDNHQVEVDNGVTILDAAAKLGIEIPTMCFLKGYEPSTSCMVCVVKVNGSDSLVPACGTIAQDGMKVESDLEEVEGRPYLKHIHLRYMQSMRDLSYFIRKEKRHLLRLSKESRDDKAKESDKTKETNIMKDLSTLNSAVSQLSYVEDATTILNEELKKLSHHHSDYTVNLESTSIDFTTFIESEFIPAKCFRIAFFINVAICHQIFGNLLYVSLINIQRF